MPNLIERLPGTLMLASKGCGRTACFCSASERVGPHFVRVWGKSGARRKVCVEPDQLARVEAGIELFDLEQRATRLRLHLERRTSWIDRQYLTAALAQLEIQAESIRTSPV